MAKTADRNKELHARWHELSARMLAASEAADEAACASLAFEREQVGEEFFTLNLPYAQLIARKWAGYANVFRDDYVAVAYEKLWASFLSWDPEKGTFSTWARAHIEGGVRREVAKQEFSGRSYDDFNARPQLLAIVAKLSEELGRTPSFDEIRRNTGIPVTDVEQMKAARESLLKTGAVSAVKVAHLARVHPKVASRFLSSLKRLSGSLGREPSAEEISQDTGVSRTSIERALSPQAARLDAPVGQEMSATLGDRLSQRLQDDGSFATDELSGLFDSEQLSQLCEGLSGQQMWTIFRLSGLDGAPPQKARDVAAQLDVGRETVRRAESLARKALAASVESLYREEGSL